MGKIGTCPEIFEASSLCSTLTISMGLEVLAVNVSRLSHESNRYNWQSDGMSYSMLYKISTCALLFRVQILGPDQKEENGQ